MVPPILLNVEKYIKNFRSFEIEKNHPPKTL